eukprot:766258-Hanusia_phi.AAC.1
MDFVKNVWGVFEGLVQGNTKVEQQESMSLDAHVPPEVNEQPTVNDASSSLENLKLEDTRSVGERLPALFAAVESGDVNSLRAHLTDKGLLSCLNPAGNSLAYEAARRGHCDSLKAIMMEGGDPNVLNSNHLTPLFGAIEGCSMDCVKSLLEANADVNHEIESGDTPISMAAYHGMAEAISLFAERGASVNEKDIDGRTPVFAAASSGKIACLKLLHGLGADFKIEDEDGETPYDAAAMAGQNECMLFIQKMYIVLHVFTTPRILRKEGLCLITRDTTDTASSCPYTTDHFGLPRFSCKTNQNRFRTHYGTSYVLSLIGELSRTSLYEVSESKRQNNKAWIEETSVLVLAVIIPTSISFTTIPSARLTQFCSLLVGPATGCPLQLKSPMLVPLGLEVLGTHITALIHHPKDSRPEYC